MILPRSSSSSVISGSVFNANGLSEENGGFLHRAHYDVQHLANGATYEAQVQARNKFGWSERSESVKFTAESRIEEESTEAPADYYTKESHKEGKIQLCKAFLGQNCLT